MRIAKQDEVARQSIPAHSTHDTINVREVWRVLKFHKLFFFLCISLALLSTTSYFYMHGPKYRASMELSLAEEPNHFRDFVPVDAGSEEITNKLAVLSELFGSPEMATRTLDALIEHDEELKKSAGITNHPDYMFMDLIQYKKIKGKTKAQRKLEAADQIMSHVSISVNNTKHEITITGETFQPAVSAFLANTVGEMLLEENRQRMLVKVRETKKFLKEQTAQAGQKLEGFEQDLVRFQKSNHMTSGDEAEHSAYDLMTKNEEQLVTLQVQYDSSTQLIQKTEAEIKKVKDNVDNPAVSASTMYLSQLQHRLSMLEYQNTLAKNSLAKSSEDPSQLEEEIKTISQTYKKALENRGQLKELAIMTPFEYYQELEKSLVQLRKDNRRLRSELDVLLSQRTERRSDIVDLSVKLQKLTEIKRNISLTSDLYVSLRKRLQDVEIEEASTMNDLTVLSRATAPDKPSNLRLRMMGVIAIMLGLGFGLFLVFMKENFIPFVRNREDLENMGMTVAAEIPEIGVLTQTIPKFRLTRSTKPLLVQVDRPDTYEADVIRFIRNRLTAFDKGAGFKAKKIQITSSEPGCGKSFLASNIALALSIAKHKTLLIDLDLRKPSVQQFFVNSKPKELLSTKMISMSKLPDTIFTPYSSTLDVIFAEQTNSPVDLLESDLIPDLLNRIKDDYEFIILDSPPVLAAIDARVIAQLADGTLFAVEHRGTFREDVKTSLNKLAEAGQTNVLGILNRIPVEFTHQAAKYYFRRSS